MIQKYEWSLQWVEIMASAVIINSEFLDENNFKMDANQNSFMIEGLSEKQVLQALMAVNQQVFLANGFTTTQWYYAAGDLHDQIYLDDFIALMIAGHQYEKLVMTYPSEETEMLVFEWALFTGTQEEFEAGNEEEEIPVDDESDEEAPVDDAPVSRAEGDEPDVPTEDDLSGDLGDDITEVSETLDGVMELVKAMELEDILRKIASDIENYEDLVLLTNDVLDKLELLGTQDFDID
jgi:hypothetical protein